jgi:hypothetical protein
MSEGPTNPPPANQPPPNLPAQQPPATPPATPAEPPRQPIVVNPPPQQQASGDMFRPLLDAMNALPEKILSAGRESGLIPTPQQPPAQSPTGSTPAGSTPNAPAQPPGQPSAGQAETPKRRTFGEWWYNKS